MDVRDNGLSAGAEGLPFPFIPTRNRLPDNTCTWSANATGGRRTELSAKGASTSSTSSKPIHSARECRIASLRQAQGPRGVLWVSQRTRRRRNSGMPASSQSVEASLTTMISSCGCTCQTTLHNARSSSGNRLWTGIATATVGADIFAGGVATNGTGGSLSARGRVAATTASNRSAMAPQPNCSKTRRRPWAANPIRADSSRSRRTVCSTNASS